MTFLTCQVQPAGSLYVGEVCSRFYPQLSAASFLMIQVSVPCNQNSLDSSTIFPPTLHISTLHQASQPSRHLVICLQVKQPTRPFNRKSACLPGVRPPTCQNQQLSLYTSAPQNTHGRVGPDHEGS